MAHSGGTNRKTQKVHTAYTNPIGNVRLKVDRISITQRAELDARIQNYKFVTHFSLAKDFENLPGVTKIKHI